MDEPFRYRNKAQFPFGTDKEGDPVLDCMPEEPMISLPIQNVSWELSK